MALDNRAPLRMQAVVNPTKTVFLLLACALAAVAQNADAPPDGALPPPARPSAEMEKWIETVHAQWEATYAKEVKEPFDAEAEKLRLQYHSTIESHLSKATGEGNLELAVTWRSERERFAADKNVPAEDEATVPAAMKQLRTHWRTQSARLEKERIERAKSLHARYDQVLGQAQTQLTQRQRLEDALLVRKKREEVSFAWLMPAAPPPGLLAGDAPAKPPTMAVAAATTPAPTRPPLGTKAGPVLAQVEAEDASLAPLAVGERVWSDRDRYLFTKITPSFAGYQFTRTKAHGLTLKFKVLTDGLVYMACTSRWGTTADPDVQKTLVTQSKLQKDGWKREQRGEFPTTDVTWLVFSRQCKAGEQFSYRTDKYAPPILLVK